MRSLILALTMLVTLFLAVSAFAAIVDPGKAGVLYNCAFPVTVKLDGDFKDWPDVPWHKIDATMGWSIPSNDKDGSLEFACVADKSFLYVGFRIWDDAKVVDENTGCDVWQDDSVEVYIDGGNEKAGAYDGNDSQITIGRDNVGGDIDKPKLGGCVGQLQGPNTGTKVAIIDTDYGWAVEVAIPFAPFGVTPADGKVIGFNVQLNDDDNKAGRDHKLAWSAVELATGEVSWNNPSVFAELKIVAAVITAVSAESKLATTWASIKK